MIFYRATSGNHVRSVPLALLERESFVRSAMKRITPLPGHRLSYSCIFSFPLHFVPCRWRVDGSATCALVGFASWCERDYVEGIKRDVNQKRLQLQRPKSFPANIYDSAQNARLEFFVFAIPTGKGRDRFADPM